LARNWVDKDKGTPVEQGLSGELAAAGGSRRHAALGMQQGSPYKLHKNGLWIFDRAFQFGMVFYANKK
jgi:hypothetical protein